MLRGGGPLTSPTSGEHTLIRGTKLESHRRIGIISHSLEQRAREAAKEYHDAIRRQKKAHWQEFLQDDVNIWQAARFLGPRDSPGV